MKKFEDRKDLVQMLRDAEPVDSIYNFTVELEVYKGPRPIKWSDF